MENYLDHIEWEGLTKPIEIDEVVSSSDIPYESGIIKIWRNESYKIKALISGDLQKPKIKRLNKDIVTGKKIIPFTIQGYSHHKTYSYELNNCHIKGTRESHSKNKHTYEADLYLNNLTVRTNMSAATNWLTDWYLNGPQDMLYPSGTERKKNGSYIRIRAGIDESSNQYSGEQSEQHCSDYACIEADNMKFLITSVPKEIGPAWSKNIGIEYRQSFGDIPIFEKRECISEIISFIFGRQLMHVGSTEFDATGCPIKQTASSPWNNNPVHLCGKPDLMPINFPYDKWSDTKIALGKITTRYLCLRNELNLKLVLMFFWISKNSPIGTNLPILAAGIEMLSRAWFSSKKSKTKGVYISKEDYEAILKEELENISQKLSKIESGENITKKIKSAYNMGANDRLLAFFDEIGLKIGALEKSAINARNSMAHGFVPTNESAWEKMLDQTYIYETLFNRIILKILGYEGNYIDRSIEGWPERHIDIPIGGDSTLHFNPV